MSAGRRNSLETSKEWGTPHKYVQAVKNVFDGVIDLDPCSNNQSIVNALTEYKLPLHDGLKLEWCYDRIYVNPPYGIDFTRKTRIYDWLEKIVNTREKYNSNIIALIPVATNTKHWKEFVFKKADSVCFLYDTRLRFLENGFDIGKGAPMACATIYYGNNIVKFSEVFKEFGAVLNLSDISYPDKC